MNGNEEKLIPSKEEILNERNTTTNIDYNAQAEAARIAEEARQKRIQEYKNLINGIKNVASRIINVNAEIQSVQQNIQMCMTGKTVNFINRLIEEAQEGIDNTINNINAIGTRAADKINNEGEPCTYEEEHADLNSNQNGNNNQFSCDTSVLRNQVLPSLQNSYRNLNGSSLDASSLQRLEGCEDVSNISPEIDNISVAINQAYQKVEEFIESIERKERENVGIIEKLSNYFNKLFNKKEENTENINNEVEETETQNESVSATTTTPKFGTLWNFTQEYMGNVTKEPTTAKEFFDNNVTTTLEYVENPNGINYAYTKSSLGADYLLLYLHGSGDGTGSGDRFLANDFNLAKILHDTPLDKANIDVIAPHLNAKFPRTGTWCYEEVLKAVEDLIQQVGSNYKGIVLVGASMGGQGAYYMAEKMPQYFDGVVVLSGGYQQPNDFGGYENIENDIKVYGAQWGDDSSNWYTSEYITKHIGEENVKDDILATHVTLPKVLFNLDEDGNGSADVMEVIKSMFGIKSNTIDINYYNSLMQGTNHEAVREYLEHLGVDLTENENVENNNLGNNRTHTIDTKKIDMLWDFQNEMNENMSNSETIEKTQGIVKLTDYDGSYAGGKINLHTQIGLLSMAQLVHDNQMDWRYSGMGDPYHGLQYSNFDAVLNNPNKATCCATYVSDVLYRCGFITPEDVSPFGRFNPNYQVNLDNGLRAKQWERIDDINCFEPGDIVFYDDQKDGVADHVEIFAGIDEETGESLWYSAGGDKAIKSVAPERRSEYFGRWIHANCWAYRPDYDKVNVNYGEEVVETNKEVLDGLGTEDAREEHINQENSNTNNSSTNNTNINMNSWLSGNNNTLTDMMTDRHVVEILANRYGVETSGKTGIAVLDEIAIKYPEISEDINAIKKNINKTIRFEKEANTPTNNQVEVNSNQNVVDGLGTDDARDEHINQENSNINNPSSNPEEKEPVETKPPSGNTNNTPSKPVILNKPGNVEIPIVGGTLEAILEAAKKIKETTSHSGYISNILHNAGYFTEEEMNLYKNYSVQEICEKFEELGWKKITNTDELKAGDIIIINDGEKVTTQIYAGNNEWYTKESKETQQMKQNWTENTTWYAYRPEKR